MCASRFGFSADSFMGSIPGASTHTSKFSMFSSLASLEASRIRLAVSWPKSPANKRTPTDGCHQDATGVRETEGSRLHLNSAQSRPTQTDAMRSTMTPRGGRSSRSLSRLGSKIARGCETAEYPLDDHHGLDGKGMATWPWRLRTHANRCRFAVDVAKGS